MSRPLKVLHILDVLRFSGAEVCLKVAGPLWADHDISCDIIATGDELGEYAPVLRDAGYRTGRIPLHPATGFFGRLARLIRREGYDVVHNHLEEANFYIDGTVRATGRRSVQHLHNVFDFEGSLKAERTAQRWGMQRMGVRFIACSPDVQRHEITHYGNPTTLLLNWADLNHFRQRTEADRTAARADLGLGDDQLVLVSVANCNDFKNHTALIEAMVGLPDHVVWLHVGQSDRTADEEAMAERLGVADRIRFMGRLSDPRSTLFAGDVYIQPSLYEGMSIAALEALSVGLPAVLTDTPGLGMLRAYDPPVRWAAETTTASVQAAVQSIVDDGPPTGDVQRVRDAISAEKAVASLAAIYRGEV